MERWIPVVSALGVLAGLLGCGVEPRSAREVMAEGLQRALPDEQLGRRTLLESDADTADPLIRNPLLCARDMGPIAFSATTRYERRDRTDALRTRLEESVHVERTGAGDFKLSMERSVEGTRKSTSMASAVFVEGRFYTADASGVFFVRNPMRAHHVEWFRDAGQPFKVLVGLVKASLRREPRGTRHWEGREGAVQGLLAVPRLQPTPEPAVAELRDSTGTWNEWWQSVHGVEAIRGEVLTDPVTGCAVAGTLELDLRFLDPSQGGDGLRIRHEFSLDILPKDPAIRSPRGARVPRRDRVHQMLREVLPAPAP